MGTLTLTETKINEALNYADDLKSKKTAVQIEESVNFTSAITKTPQDLIKSANQAATQSSSAGMLMSVLKNNLRDAYILILGDSTGNDSNEWPTLLSAWLADKYKYYNIEFYSWDVENNQFYESPTTTVRTESGTHTLKILNASIGGARPDYMIGHRFGAVTMVDDIDLIIHNYGHNIASSSVTKIEYSRILSTIVECIAHFAEIYPAAGCIVIGQNTRTDRKMEFVIPALLEAAALMDCDYADVFTKFKSHPNTASLLTDGVHTTNEGNQIYLEALQERFSTLTHRSVRSPFAEYNINIIDSVSAKFTGYNGGNLPPRLLRSANTKHELDTANSDYNPTLMKLSSQVVDGGNTLLMYQLDQQQLNLIRGKWVTAVMRVFRPLESTPITSGSIEFRIDVTQYIPTSETTNLPIGRFVYRIFTFQIPVSATNVALRFLADRAETNAEITLGGIGLFLGKIPSGLY